MDSVQPHDADNIGVGVVGDKATLLAEKLVGYAAAHKGHHGYLVLDPVLRNGFDVLREVATAYTAVPEFEARPIPVAPSADYARKRWPLLVRLPALDTYAGSEINRHAVQMALDDWEIPSLREGGGHRVCAWLFSREEPSQLAVQLGRRGVHRRPDRRRTLIRFWDPAVMDQLWAASSTEQRTWLLDPVARWAWVDRWGELTALVAEERTAAEAGHGPDRAPFYGAEQWVRLDHVGPLNRLWVKAHAQGIALTREQMADAERALQRAHAAGFVLPDDLLQFAWRAVSVAANFDRHPEIRALLDAREPDDTFAYAVADLDEAGWRRVATEAAALSVA